MPQAWQALQGLQMAAVPIPLRMASSLVTTYPSRVCTGQSISALQPKIPPPPQFVVGSEVSEGMWRRPFPEVLKYRTPAMNCTLTYVRVPDLPPYHAIRG